MASGSEGRSVPFLPESLTERASDRHFGHTETVARGKYHDATKKLLEEDPIQETEKGLRIGVSTRQSLSAR
jgi:hypothetical protein